TLRRVHIELLTVRPPGMRIVERNVATAIPFVRGGSPNWVPVAVKEDSHVSPSVNIAMAPT
ncbi:hypothetical protein BS47DRAFT_1342186, partial [Hydnum rufescens UP504]